MTAFSDADLDRLADFVGGALEGTPDADHVRRLVSTDVTWAEAYASLVTADAAVRDELRALGTEAQPVPPDVQQRLDAALATALTAPPADAVVVDLARAREARKRRRQRWLVGLGAAAAVLACAGIGVQVVRQQVTNSSDSAATSGHAPEGTRGSAMAPDAAAPNSAAGGAPGSASTIMMTGRDYGPNTVGQLAQGSPAPPAAFNSDGSSGKRTDLSEVPDPLRRLGDPAARILCLSSITREYGGQVSLVDYARFEGRPALVVIVDGTRLGAGKRLVVVVGPDCGLGGAIGEERFRGTA
ncbi:hypothetical protein Drose_38300 [Dactylosporangium roseum]|uniref:Anti-sigma factor n=1 Tax=Dactylosporangium roseum TaxID=47989 RepID=A0ABY5Z5L4_9ACTN|nr:hypothetical protein [Dactylosporangium roseum]UWZ36772.1 hypothetical protein Drose_38300 [Dactylosporangium roseum]